MQGQQLSTGKTRSCGCLRSIVLRQRNTKHLMYGTPEHSIWHDMHRRCEDTKNKWYRRYGGRGIHVCERWSTFEAFYSDMGPRPSPLHTVDRIDNDGPYSPENCRWATRSEQSRNNSRTRRLTFRDKTQSLIEWAEDLGRPYGVLQMRLQRGWSIERALTQGNYIHDSP